MKKLPERILFYDGECAFCNRAVQFILNHEKGGSDLHFCSLQDPIAEVVFQERGIAGLGERTMVLIWDDGVMVKSGAGLFLCTTLSPPFSWLGVFKILPTKWRDYLYDFIASRRRRIFKSGYCVIPGTAQSDRILG